MRKVGGSRDNFEFELGNYFSDGTSLLLELSAFSDNNYTLDLFYQQNLESFMQGKLNISLRPSLAAQVCRLPIVGESQ